MIKVIVITISLILVGGAVMGKPPVFKGHVNYEEIDETKLMSKVSAAFDVAKMCISDVEAGDVWVKRSPKGELELKGAVLYKGRVVSVIHFSPESGEVLPKGFHPKSYELKVSLSEIHNRLSHIVKRLKPVYALEYREPEMVWAVPLSYEGKLVSYLKIFWNATSVVPDYPAEDEMKNFAK